jgi:release factor glutamine methyltransferase
MSSPTLLTGPDIASMGLTGVERFNHWHGALVQGLLALPDKPEETPASAMRALWLRAADLKLSVEAAGERVLPALSETQQLALGEWVARRLAGMPLAHITERQRFMGLELLAGPQALIPRRETELLGAAAADLLQSAARARGQALAIDVCTGSGNLAFGMASRVAAARVLATDLSEEAVALARLNAAHLGLRSRVELRQGDLLAPFDEPEFIGRVDVLVCNPPYISSGKLATMPGEIADFEPQLAFDGGPFGIRILQRLIREAPRFVRPGGWLAFEVGRGQGPAVMKRLTPEAGFGELRAITDPQQQVRAVLAQLLARHR